MDSKLLYSLPCLLLAACASETPDKYRDIKHLEFPPTLAIEHTGRTPVEPETVTKTKPKVENNSETTQDKPASSPVSKLVLLAGTETKPILQLKTRFERAWDLVDHGLRLAEIEVVDKNYAAGTIRVRYVANNQGKGRGVVNSITSFFSDTFDDTEYTLSLDKDKKITDVQVAKVIPADQKPAEGNTEAFNNDDSASLVKLLHKTIIDDLEK